MNLLPTPEQHEIASAAAAFLAKELPPGSAAPDEQLWRQMGGLGWFTLAIREQMGGTGYGIEEEMLLFRELGRVVASGPFLATALASHVAAVSGDRALVEQIASGSVRVGLAEPWRDTMSVVGPSVSGRFRVLDGAGASLLCVVDPRGAALVDVSAAEGAGAARASFEPMDPGTTVELLTLPPVQARHFVPPSTAPIPAVGAILVTALLTGICEATRDQSVGYVKEREQFGKPIGSFQAVKHRCADMAVRSEAAVSLSTYATLAVRGGLPDGPQLLPLTKALVSEYAVASAADNIQNHGGMGFTAECTAHLYLKRANVLSTVLGTPAQLWSATLS
ncbi:MAG TPA: acyl-CoA dehydrogenase family protein [Acidimicrobiales bacterium]|nr:acyl-CoA dehydrogenase family protein [Acidimicrobiales bacterium]